MSIAGAVAYVRAHMQFILCAMLLAQSLNARGVQRLNQDVQELWAHDGLPLARDAAQSELQKLQGVPHTIAGGATATLANLRSLTLDAPVAPGLLRLDQGGATVALPLSGAWNLGVSADLNVHAHVLFWDVDTTFPISIALKNLTAQLSATFDSTDPSAPKVSHVSPPVVHFTLQITSSNAAVAALGWLTSTLVNGVGQGVMQVAAVYVAHKLQLMVQDTPAVQNAGGPALQPVRRGDLEGAARRLGDEIESFRTPFGPILETKFDQPYHGTWADSFADPGFSPGHVTGAHAYGDSGEMTGHYLAALSFQYAATRDATAKARAQRALNTLTTLLTMRGEPGNMNRSIMPVAWLEGWQQPKPGYTSGEDYARVWNGQPYYFSDYMSRDEYMGLFYGLAIARDLLDDPAMKAQAQAGMEMALDYLVRNRWTWRRLDGSWGERWAGVLEEQYAWILAAWSGNKPKYQALHDDYAGFADLVWTGYWTAAIDPYDTYYKFQLGAGAIQVLLSHEPDPASWQRAYQGVQVLRHYIGHHLNAHFNNVYLAFDASSKARLGAENENLLSRWLLWPRRRERVNLHGDPTIEKTTFTQQTDATGGHGTNTIEIAKYPLPPDKRIGSGFMWSVSPCQLDPGFAAPQDAYIEGETLDFVLPYWMARYYRAIVPPRGIGISTQ